MRVFISGQKYFGEQVLRLCIQAGCQVVGVCCPIGDKYIGKLAATFDVPITPAGSLTAEAMPDFDLGITAHSFDYISKPQRLRAKIGWLGYHPSLLPRHRGRSSIEWAIKMRDVVTGGTVFWLNGGIDRGHIAYQDWRFIDPALFAMPSREAAAKLWRDELQALGITLLKKAIQDVAAGQIIAQPQDSRFSTFEPSLDDLKDIFKPDLIMIPCSTT